MRRAFKDTVLSPNVVITGNVRRQSFREIARLLFDENIARNAKILFRSFTRVSKASFISESLLFLVRLPI